MKKVLVSLGQRSKGGIAPPCFSVFWGYRENAPALAPNCPKFNYYELARHPQPMPGTHTFFVFVSGTVLGLAGPQRKRGQTNPPL